jgi:hypothetical protein
MAGDKVNNKELKDIVEKAYDLRYNQNYGQRKYVAWAKKEYGKSEQQCCQYFLKAKDHHTTMWKDLLEKQLTPAVEELIRLMADENPKIRQRAIDQIVKYTGNDIQKIQAEIKGDIEVSFNAPDN